MWISAPEIANTPWIPAEMQGFSLLQLFLENNLLNGIEHYTDIIERSGSESNFFVPYKEAKGIAID